MAKGETWRVELTDRAKKSIKRFPKDRQRRILLATDKLSSDRFLGKPLRGQYAGLFSLRVWPYRVIYQIIDQKLLIVVVEIGHRQGIYR